MRYKRRYICAEVEFDKYTLAKTNKLYVHKLRHTNLTKAISDAYKRYYGDYGLATFLPSFSVMYYNAYTNIAIMRTSRDAYKNFLKVLSLLKIIGSDEVTFKILHLAGSVRLCKKFLLRHCSRKLNEIENRKGASQDDEQKMEVTVLEKIVKNCENINTDDFKL